MARLLVRISLLSSIAVSFTASCNVDDDGFRFEPKAELGEGGDDGNAAGAPSRGGNTSGGSSAGASAGSAGEGGEALPSGGEPGEAFAGSGGEPSTGTGGRSTESNGGAAGEPGVSTGGSDVVGAAGSLSVDDECSGANRCAPDLPAGWTGPIAIYEGSEDDVPECPNGPELFDAGVRPAQDPLECAPCICGSVNGGTCSLAVRTYNDEGCTIQTSTVGITDTCTVPISSTAFRFEGFELDGGSCNPSGGNLIDRPEPRFQSVARGCALAPDESATCARGSVCLPEPTLPFRDDLCIFRVGDHDCPAAYPDQRSYYTGLTDDRTCSSCGCRAPNDCTGTLTAYNSQSCVLEEPDYRSEPVSLGATGACRRVESISVLALQLTDVEYPGGCEPIAPVSTQGSVSAEGAITVCCL